MKNMKNLFYILGFYLLSFNSASAHIKWFVDEEEVIATKRGLNPFFNIESSEVWIWMGISLLVVLVYGLIDKFVKEPKGLNNFANRNAKVINRIAQVVLGIFLITVSFVWKIILVPSIDIDSTLTLVLSLIQALVGIMFVFNVYPRVASILLILFCFGVGIYGGLITFLENLILVSLAIYFFIKNSQTNINYPVWNKYSLLILRLGVGLSLIVLAFTEKLAYPELSLAFLETHNWNFMQIIFPWFTNELFVLSVGFAEIIFGVLFVLGYMTRITTILIAIFFAFSVTTMLMQFGIWEVEDLVVYSAAIVFLFFGGGEIKFKRLIK